MVPGGTEASPLAKCWCSCGPHLLQPAPELSQRSSMRLSAWWIRRWANNRWMAIPTLSLLTMVGFFWGPATLKTGNGEELSD